MTFPSQAVMKVPKPDGRHPTCLNIPDGTHCVISGFRGLVSLYSLIFVMVLPVCAAAQAPTKRILILSGSDPNYPGFSTISQSMRSTVRDGSSSRIEFIYELQEDLVKPPDSERDDQELAAYLSRKYEGKKIDLILGLVAPRLRLLLKHNPGLFAHIPKIFYDFEDEREATIRDLGPNVTGVWVRLELTQTLDLALALQPEARRVLVVTGNSDQDRLRREKAHTDFRKYESRAEFTYVTNLTLEELKGQLAALPKNCIVIYLSFGTDRAGDKYSGPEALSMIAPTSGAPIYGNSDTLMGAGIVGGSLLNFEGIGKQIGSVTLRLMAGEQPKDIPSSTVPSVTTFDWRELRRWGIDESRLPTGSIVRYKEFSTWDLYKWRIIGVTSLCILEAVLIVGLLFSRAKRRQALKENERLARVAKAEHQRLEEVVSNVPGLVWEVAIDPASGKRKTTFVSGYAEQMLGYREEDFLGATHFGMALVPEEDRERVERETKEILDAGKSGTIQFRWQTKDGRVLWVQSQVAAICDETGRTIGLCGVTMDITARKEVEQSLRTAHEEVNKLKNQLEAENIYFQEEIKLTLNLDEIVGRSNAIKYVLFKIEQVGKTDSTVMILGETGTGKELVARAIHSQSLRKDRPLVKVNCAALSASLIENELFGHEKGAFTGAAARKPGRFELADGATIFLDEIGELPLDLQSKLLRVIQEGEFERLGGSKTVKVDVRIIAATNRDMKTEVEKGAFREDLWYRLNVFPITVPPLRQRREDIPPMVEHFVSSFSRKVGKDITAVSSATLKKLQDYSWPGNVRELANVIERGVINAPGPVLYIADRFEQELSPQLPGASRTLDEIEKEYITRILDDTAWRIEGPSGAARILGLNPSTLRTRMVRLGIQKSAHSAARG